MELTGLLRWRFPLVTVGSVWALEVAAAVTPRPAANHSAALRIPHALPAFPGRYKVRCTYHAHLTSSCIPPNGTKLTQAIPLFDHRTLDERRQRPSRYILHPDSICYPRHIFKKNYTTLKAGNPLPSPLSSAPVFPAAAPTHDPPTLRRRPSFPALRSRSGPAPDVAVE